MPCPCGRGPALGGPRLEHSFGEFEERAVGTPDYGMPFGTPLIVKAIDDFVGIEAGPCAAEFIERFARRHRRIVGIGESGLGANAALVHFRLPAELRITLLPAVGFLDGELYLREGLAFPNALIIDREARIFGALVYFIDSNIDDVTLEVLPCFIGVFRDLQPVAQLIHRY